MRIATESTQCCALFSGSVDRGWRVALLPTRVGQCARVPEGGAGAEHGAHAQYDAAAESGVEAQRAVDAKGLRR